MYGTQTKRRTVPVQHLFENDVKMYGTQTDRKKGRRRKGFENDVKMYGTQTQFERIPISDGLRMM